MINFADGAVEPTISLASVATGAGEDDDQSDSDYGKNIDWIYYVYLFKIQVFTTSALEGNWHFPS